MSGWHAMHTIGPNLARSTIGYLNSSSLPLDYSGCVPTVTYEGDNNVLLQQTAKFLLLQFDNIRKGRDLSPTF
jgi:acyl-CoA oxidase